MLGRNSLGYDTDLSEYNINVIDGNLNLGLPVVTDVITCRVINAEVENVITTNNDDVTGYVHATGDIIANYGTGSQVSLTDLATTVSELVSDETKTQYQSASGNVTSWVGGTKVSTTTAGQQAQITDGTNYISLVPNEAPGNGPIITVSDGSSHQSQMTSTQIASANGNFTTSNIKTLNIEGTNSSLVVKDNTDTNIIYLNPNVPTPLIVNGNINAYSFITANSSASTVFETKDIDGNSTSSIDNSGNFQCNSILINGSDAQILTNGDASLGNVTVTKMTSVGDVISSGCSSLNTLKSSVDTNTSNISTNTSNISTNTSSISTINGKLTTDESNISTLQSQMSTANTNITSLQTSVSTISGKQSTDETNITTLQGQMTTANSNISTNTSNISTNTTAISTINGKLTTDESNISTLQGQMSTANSNITTLQGKTAHISDSGSALTLSEDTSVGGNLVVSGNLTVNGSTITANSKIVEYEYISIIQNPADGVNPALSVVQGGTSSGAILEVKDADSNIIFDINQDCNINLNGKFSVTSSSGDVVCGKVTSNGTDIIPSNYLQVTNNLSDLNSVSTARSNLGLGTCALMNEVNNKVYYVSPNGSDSNDGLTLFTPLATLGRGLTLNGNSGGTIYIFPGSYAQGGLSVTAQNVDIVGMNGGGGICYLTGTINIANTASSVRFLNISFDTVNHNNAGSVYFRQCSFNVTFNQTSTGGSQFINCDTQGSSLTGTVNVSSASTCIMVGGTIGIVTLSNSAGSMAISNAMNCAPITVTAGVLTVLSTPIYAVSSSYYGLTATATGGAGTTIISLNSCSFINANDLSQAKISIGANVSYSLQLLLYNKVSSTISGSATNISNFLYGDKLNLNTLQLNGTGGTSQVLKQTSSGGNITVGQLSAVDLSNGTTGSGSIVLATSPTITGTINGGAYCYNGGTATVGSIVDLGNANNSMIVPKGTTAQEPSAVEGMIRYNTDTHKFEGASGSSPAWSALGGGGGITNYFLATQVSATLTNVLGNGGSYLVIFNTLTSGSGYNTSNGKWTAPSSGTYQMQYNLLISNISASNNNFVNFYVYDNTAGAIYALFRQNGYTGGASDNRYYISCGCLMPVTSGHDYVVYGEITGSANNLSILPNSTFSGFQVA